MRRSIGLFGGTFNPIHFGHINLALELKEKKDLDEIWFIPAHCSPLKMDEPCIEPKYRSRMVELAIEPLEGFKISKVELERPPPSYTLDSIKILMKQYPQDHFSLLMGEDTLAHFAKWKGYQEIIRLIPLWIGSRTHYPSKQIAALQFDQELACLVLQGIIPIRQLEISASEIRNRLKKKLYCGHFLPPKVLDYIYEHQLYFIPKQPEELDLG